MEKKARVGLCLSLLLFLGLAVFSGRSRAATVHFKQLMPFVELKLSGWTMDAKPTGTTIKHGEATMSEARATYRNGDKTLEIVVMDFLGKTIPFLGPMTQMEMETSEETMRTTTIQGFKAVETFRTQEHHAELNISVADRFWVKIDGDGLDNPEVLRTVAQQMELPKLAELAK